MVLFNEMFKSYNSFILLAVPFFLLTANLMNVGGITDRLMRLSRALVGHFPGGLAQINVVLSVFFAGISGSSTADAASQGKLFIEAQVKEGYDLSFSIAITAVSAVLAVIIPPSILMVVWGGVISTSIGAMYLAGIVPGLLIGGAQMLTVHAYAKRRNYPVYPKAKFSEIVESASISIPALMTPVIIVGGILLGWFTATESAAVAVIYAAVLSIFFYRELTPAQLWEAIVETGRLSAIALFCVGTASVFGWLLAYYQIPKALLSNVQAWGLRRYWRGYFDCGRIFDRGMFFGCYSRHHYCWHYFAAIGGISRYAPRAFCNCGYRVVGVWIDNAALWDVLADFLCSSQSAAQICIERHDDHADSHVGRLVWRHRVS